MAKSPVWLTKSYRPHERSFVCEKTKTTRTNKFEGVREIGEGKALLNSEGFLGLASIRSLAIAPQGQTSLSVAPNTRPIPGRLQTILLATCWQAAGGVRGTQVR
jgi:hypothetical protein